VPARFPKYRKGPNRHCQEVIGEKRKKGDMFILKSVSDNEIVIGVLKMTTEIQPWSSGSTARI
jgi:hypothetical protein